METNKFVQMLAQVNQMAHRQRNTLLTARSHLPDDPRLLKLSSLVSMSMVPARFAAMITVKKGIIARP